MRITDRIDQHAAERPDCRACAGTGLVCERHPNLPWDSGDEIGCTCLAPGMECLLIDGDVSSRWPYNAIRVAMDGRDLDMWIKMDECPVFPNGRLAVKERDGSPLYRPRYSA